MARNSIIMMLVIFVAVALGILAIASNNVGSIALGLSGGETNVATNIGKVADANYHIATAEAGGFGGLTDATLAQSQPQDCKVLYKGWPADGNPPTPVPAPYDGYDDGNTCRAPQSGETPDCYQTPNPTPTPFPTPTPGPVKGWRCDLLTNDLHGHEIESDSTLTGTGLSSAPLAVAHPVPAGGTDGDCLSLSSGSPAWAAVCGTTYTASHGVKIVSDDIQIDEAAFDDTVSTAFYSAAGNVRPAETGLFALSSSDGSTFYAIDDSSFNWQTLTGAGRVYFSDTQGSHISGFGVDGSKTAVSFGSGDKLIIQAAHPLTAPRLTITLSSGPTAFDSIGKWYSFSAIAVDTGFATDPSDAYRVALSAHPVIQIPAGNIKGGDSTWVDLTGGNLPEFTGAAHYIVVEDANGVKEQPYDDFQKQNVNIDTLVRFPSVERANDNTNTPLAGYLSLHTASGGITPIKWTAENARQKSFLVKFLKQYQVLEFGAGSRIRLTDDATVSGDTFSFNAVISGNVFIVGNIADLYSLGRDLDEKWLRLDGSNATGTTAITQTSEIPVRSATGTYEDKTIGHLSEHFTPRTTSPFQVSATWDNTANKVIADSDKIGIQNQLQNGAMQLVWGMSANPSLHGVSDTIPRADVVKYFTSQHHAEIVIGSAIIKGPIESFFKNSGKWYINLGFPADPDRAATVTGNPTDGTAGYVELDSDLISRSEFDAAVATIPDKGDLADITAGTDDSDYTTPKDVHDYTDGHATEENTVPFAAAFRDKYTRTLSATLNGITQPNNAFISDGNSVPSGAPAGTTDFLGMAWGTSEADKAALTGIAAGDWFRVERGGNYIITKIQFVETLATEKEINFWFNPSTDEADTLAYDQLDTGSGEIRFYRQPQPSVFWLTSVGGTGNAITASAAGLDALEAGQMVILIATSNNTGATTIKINSLGATALKTNANAALSSGAIASGTLYIAVYDGTAFRLMQ